MLRQLVGVDYDRCPTELDQFGHERRNHGEYSHRYDVRKRPKHDDRGPRRVDGVYNIVVVSYYDDRS